MPHAGRPQAHLCRPAYSSLHRNLNILLPAPLHQEPALLVRDRPPVESLRLADLFSAQLQRVRSRDSKADIASSWEIHTKTWQQVNVSTCKKELQAALPERYGGVLEESHLDLKLR